LFIKSDFSTAQSFSDFDVVIIDPKDLSSLWYRKSKTAPSGYLYTNTQEDGGFGRCTLSLLDRRKKEIENVLKVIPGIVICYLRKHESLLDIIYQGSYIHPTEHKYLDIYSWLPTYEYKWMEGHYDRSTYFPKEINFTLREGKEISFIERSHSFSKYFEAFKGNINFECIIEIEKNF
jgi:hypothetical protein